ncbi:hypothetical protein ACS0TY_029912 [Phlomoides rotata]
MVVDPIQQHLDDWLNRQATGEGQTLLLSTVSKMDGFGSGDLGDGEKGKNVRRRRSGSKLEEDALVICLIEIVNNGWKSDNGFRARFQRELEKGMRALIPGTDLLATPHINYKIHQWKKDYGYLFDVLSKIGVGWNCTTHTLDVIDEGVWEAKKKWQDIFGRDRATGEHSVAAIDIVNDMLRYSETGESVSVDKQCTADHVPELVEENTPISKTANTSVKKGKGIRRKPIETEITALVSTLGQFMKSSGDTFGSIAHRMGNEHEAKVARTTLNDIMKQIPGLSLQDKLKVSNELVLNNNRLEYFLSLPPDEQAEYVIMLLDGRLN